MFTVKIRTLSLFSRLLPEVNSSGENQGMKGYVNIFMELRIIFIHTPLKSNSPM